MKRYLLSLMLCLCGSWAWAFDSEFLAAVTSGDAAASGACGCTGAVTFCWAMTSNNTTITSSGGCSAGDTSAYLESQAALIADPTGIKGGYVLSTPSSYDSASFDTSGILSISEGTLEFDYYPTSINVDYQSIFFVAGNDGVDNIKIFTTSSGEIYLVYEAQNSGEIYTSLPSSSLAINNWYKIRAKWRQGSITPTLSLQVNGGTAATSSTQLLPSIWTTPATTLYFPSTNPANYGYYKNIKIWSTWQ